MAGGGDDDLGLNHVGVHAHLCVVVQGHQGPVGDGAADIPAAHIILTHHKILNCGGVEELDIGGLDLNNHMSDIQAFLAQQLQHDQIPPVQ